MAKMTVLVCDKCGSQDGVETWQVVHGLEKAVLDLCGACSEPLAQLLTLAAEKAPAGRSAPRAPRAARAPRAKVTTLEEIEAMKKKK